MITNFEKEIKQQPQIIADILCKHLSGECVTGFDYIQNFKHITLIASGTSKNAGDFGAYFFEQISGIPSKSEFASEILEKQAVFDENDLIIFISQSGQSKDVLLAFDKIQKTSATTLALVNNPISALASFANLKIDIQAGKEKAVPATKSFTASVVKLFLLSIYFAQKNCIDTKNLTDDLKKLPDAIENLLTSDLPNQMANNFLPQIFLGRGCYNFALNEAVLKLKEAAVQENRAFPLGEYVHGHMVTLKDSDNITVVSFDYDEIHKLNVELIKKIQKKYNSKINFLDKKSFELSSKFLTPLLIVVFYQLLALKIAQNKGLNPDMPRGLKKITK